MLFLGLFVVGDFNFFGFGVLVVVVGGWSVVNELILSF